MTFLPSETKPAQPDGFETDTFDIFSGISDRDAVWIEAVIGIDKARARMQQIADSEPGDYFIFHTQSGGILARLHTEAKNKDKSKRQSGVG